jgi:hypothetical protein
MRRRAFLKLVGLAGVASTAPLQALAGIVEAGGGKRSVATAVPYDSLLYAPGGDGRILVSADGGRTWSLHANFGPACAVDSLSVAGGRLVAAASYERRGFPLYLGNDRRTWLTV